MKDGGICAMPQTASSVIKSALQRFPHEFNNKIANKVS